MQPQGDVLQPLAQMYHEAGNASAERQQTRSNQVQGNFPPAFTKAHSLIVQQEHDLRILQKLHLNLPKHASEKHSQRKQRLPITESKRTPARGSKTTEAKPPYAREVGDLKPDHRIGELLESQTRKFSSCPKM